jgi:hypothetical protein
VALMPIVHNPIKQAKAVEGASAEKSKHLKDFMKGITDIFE